MPTNKDYINAKSLNRPDIDRGYTALAIAIVIQAVDDMRYYNHMRKLYPDFEEYTQEFEDAEQFLCSDACAEMFDLDFKGIVDIVMRENGYDKSDSSIFADTDYRNKLIKICTREERKKFDRTARIASKIDFDELYRLTGLTPKYVRKNDSRGI